MKSIKRTLKEEGKRILPRKELKDEIKEKLQISPNETIVAPDGSAAIKHNKKLLISAVALLVAVCLFLGILLPLLLRKKTSNGFDFTNKFSAVHDADSFCSYGAMSVGLLLSAAVPANSATPYSATNGNDKKQTDVDALNKYMPLVEGLLCNQEITAGEIAEKRGYENAAAVSFGVIYGDRISFSLYYNKVRLNDDSAQKENYSLDGVLVIGNAEYPVDGVYRVKSKGDEVETEMRFTAYTSGTKDSYVVMRYETSEDSEERETEYEYATFVDGKECEKTCISYEVENNEIEVKATFRKNGKKDVIKFREKIENGVSVIVADGSLNNENVSFLVDAKNGKYNYAFSDGTSVVKSRFDSDDDDGNDSDDDSDDDSTDDSTDDSDDDSTDDD